MGQTDDLVRWLRDAHSLEVSQTEVLQNHSIVTQNIPELFEQYTLHMQQTREHVDKVSKCLHFLAAEPSPAKSIFGDIAGRLAAFSTGFSQDQILKNLLIDHAVEHFEIGCYTSIITTAEKIGFPHIATVAREILRDEERMAAWLKTEIPRVTKVYLDVRSLQR